MSVITARAFPDQRFSWPRVSALSGTMTVHIIAAALVLAPLTAQETLEEAKPIPPVVSVMMVAPKKPPPPVRLEPLPPPQVPALPRQRMPTPALQPFVPDAVMPIPADPPPVSIAAPIEAVPTPTFVAPSAQISIAELYRPKYPRDALRQRKEGEVVLRVMVGIDGVPEDVQVERSSGNKSLDRAAREAVEKWIFNPGMQDGVAQRAQALVPIVFRLQEL